MKRNSTALFLLLMGSALIFTSTGCDENILTESATGAEKPVYKFVTLADPYRVEAYYGNVWVATFTDASYTVTLAGPSRTFTETNTVNGQTYTATVSHSTWVRTLPAPFGGRVNTTWLANALAANRAGVPDILAISMQYIDGASTVTENGLDIAGDADYGPLDADSNRIEGSDFNDYLGIAWTYSYSDETDQPESAQIGSLDCSGFMRMVWGYRHSMEGYGYSDRIPLILEPSSYFAAMPRKSYQICDSSLGNVIIANSGAQATDLSKLRIGDLVFFDADTSATDGSRIDHVGMYIGPDGQGLHRFISSRKSINGPTMGDYKGSSLLNKYVLKNGVSTPVLYTAAFRAARRL